MKPAHLCHFYWLLSLLTLMPGLSVCSAQVADRSPTSSPQPAVELRVLSPPIPVMANGETVLAYELYLVNFSNKTLMVRELVVRNARDSGSVAVFDSRAIKERLYTPAQRPDSAQSFLLGPGSFAIAYLELTVPTSDIPDSLFHRMSFSNGEEAIREQFATQGAATLVRKEATLSLASPLAGGPWGAVYDPAWARGHRRVFFTVGGIARIPGRFAIDFVKLDNEGKTGTGNMDSTKNWHGYGADVFAVANGVVASTRTDFTESPTLSAHPDYSAEMATGNYVVLKVAADRYVFYEHLQPGSIRVKAGQRVGKGELVGRVGFTGQSTGPHLHFHVADADSPLGAEGVPFVFDQFYPLGSYSDFSTFGKSLWEPVANTAESPIRRQRPASNQVIRFAD